MKANLYLILDNIRSTYNVGSLLRTADGFGVNVVYLCGYTPYPKTENDQRLDHISRKTEEQIRKTALGAEKSQSWKHMDSTKDVLSQLRKKGVFILALEQTARSVPLAKFKFSEDIALILGNEIEGIDNYLLEMADAVVDLPMRGLKESFNVSVAGAIALFYLTNML